MGAFFDHERLKVYQEAIAFVAWWETVSSRCGGVPMIRDQIDRASTSIPLNIAEGNGKFSARDRCRYLQVATGSALECAAGLDVLVARKRLRPLDVEPGKKRLQEVVSMLIGLINRLNDRVAEEPALYVTAATPDEECQEHQPK
jgi:four helix bundle protein